MRGVGWDFGQHVYVPRGPSALPAERGTFVKNTVWQLVRNQLLIDFVDTVEKMTPGVTASGGTIFLPQLPPLQRYAFSTYLHLASLLTYYTIAISEFFSKRHHIRVPSQKL